MLITRGNKKLFKTEATEKRVARPQKVLLEICDKIVLLTALRAAPSYPASNSSQRSALLSVALRGCLSSSQSAHSAAPHPHCCRPQLHQCPEQRGALWGVATTSTASTASRVNRLPIRATSTTSTQILYINVFVYKHIYVTLYLYIKTFIYTRAYI